MVIRRKSSFKSQDKGVYAFITTILTSPIALVILGKIIEEFLSKYEFQSFVPFVISFLIIILITVVIYFIWKDQITIKNIEKKFHNIFYHLHEKHLTIFLLLFAALFCILAGIIYLEHWVILFYQGANQLLLRIISLILLFIFYTVAISLSVRKSKEVENLKKCGVELGKPWYQIFTDYRKMRKNLTDSVIRRDFLRRNSPYLMKVFDSDLGRIERIMSNSCLLFYDDGNEKQMISVMRNETKNISNEPVDKITTITFVNDQVKQREGLVYERVGNEYLKGKIFTTETTKNGRKEKRGEIHLNSSLMPGETREIIRIFNHTKDPDYERFFKGDVSSEWFFLCPFFPTHTKEISIGYCDIELDASFFFVPAERCVDSSMDAFKKYVDNLKDVDKHNLRKTKTSWLSKEILGLIGVNKPLQFLSRGVPREELKPTSVIIIEFEKKS